MPPRGSSVVLGCLPELYYIAKLAVFIIHYITLRRSISIPRDTGDVRSIRRPVDPSRTTVSLLLHLSFSGTVERHAMRNPFNSIQDIVVENVDDTVMVENIGKEVVLSIVNK